VTQETEIYSHITHPVSADNLRSLFGLRYEFVKKNKYRNITRLGFVLPHHGLVQLETPTWQYMFKVTYYLVSTRFQNGTQGNTNKFNLLDFSEENSVVSLWVIFLQINGSVNTPDSMAVTC
jgi:hypothetical protein